ncbi:TetR/AcrR family transcriptional regulator [Agromyces sp. NPDC058484]|uniref:TetR/AcrR family transcriptional regulator n=1 Tax=Agromyces sp. NPDC058484 TaxID=3346524 RepID=UPI00365EE4AE
MTAGDLTRMPEERRRRLIGEASREFADSGYEHASLNRIIRACGMSKSSFYHFVASKAALFDLVLDELRTDVATQLSIPRPEEFAGERFWSTAEAFLRQLTERAQTDESFTALGRMVYATGVPTDAQGPIRAIFVVAEEWLEAVLVVGRRDGAIRGDIPPALQTRLVFALLRTLDEWAVSHVGELAPAAMGELAEAQGALLRRMLQPTG